MPATPATETAERAKDHASRRATGLPPEQRRAAIAAAALRLLLEHGTNITTRQIAEAANVAEGTTFRVFPDKDAVIRAAVDLALDPAPIALALSEIDRSLPFEQQLVEAVEIIQRRMIDIGRLVSAVGGPAVFAGRERPLPDMAALTSLFAPERDRLRYDPDRAARLLPALTLAFSHPALYGDQPMSPPEIVSLLLDGIRARPEATTPPAAAVLIRLLRTRLAPYRGLLLVLLVLQGIQALLNLYLPNLNAQIINKGVLTGNTGYIWHKGGEMLCVALLQACFAIAAVYLGSRVAMGFGRDVRDALFHRSVQLSAREVNQLGAPSLITRVTNDVQQVQLLVVMSCTMVLAAPVTIIGGIFLALRQDAGLSWLLGLSMPVLAVALGTVIGLMVPQFRMMQERLDNVNRVLREQITGIRVVRAFVREHQESRRFRTVNDELTGTSLVAGRLMALMFPIVMLVINCSNSAVVWFGANRIAHGQMTLGSLIAFLTYFTLILMAVMMATFVGVMAPRAAVSAERIQEVLSTEPSVVPPSDPVTSLRTPGTLELSGVSFGYPGAETPVLDGISFRVLPGQTTAVVGSTGSGKTTLVNLVARLIDVTAGAVLIGGVDVRELDPDILWHRIGLVPQRPYLFTGTVASNLRYGQPDATDDELWTALEVAAASDFVTAMGGLDAPIAQGGTNVSGGQRQRLSIARALARRPDVYIFDDSFSSLDLATDARVRTALGPYTVGSSVLVVAQRVSTIMSADQILVLDDGRPVGLGTHSELLETCETYVEIVASQANAEDAA